MKDRLTLFAAWLLLPEYSYILPDVNDDAHNGKAQQAETWLQAKVIGPLSTNSVFEPGGDGVLIVDFDEAADTDTTHGGGHVACVLWGPGLKAGFRQSSSRCINTRACWARRWNCWGCRIQEPRLARL